MSVAGFPLNWLQMDATKRFHDRIARELKVLHVSVLANCASAVQPPTLLIVGSDDHKKIALNRKTMTRTNAIHLLAPTCARSHGKIVGHGVDANNTFYCGVHRAKRSRVRRVDDRI